MKRFVILLAIATFMLFSLSVSAEGGTGTVHNVTITPDSTTLSPGDTVSVEVKIDNTEKICGLQYSLKLDPNVFSVNSDVYPDLDGLPQFVDKDWYDNYKSQPSYKSFLISNFNYTDNINALLANVNGFSKENSTENMIIGKFNLTVKDVAPMGETTLSLVNSKTVDDFTSIKNIPDAEIVSNEVKIDITGNSTSNISDINITDGKKINSISIENSKSGTLIIAAYKLVDGKQVLTSVTSRIIYGTDYQNGTAKINTDFAIPDGTSLIKTLFCPLNSKEPVLKTQYLN